MPKRRFASRHSRREPTARWPSRRPGEPRFDRVCGKARDIAFYDNLKRAITQNSKLINCSCRLCRAGTGRRDHEHPSIDRQLLLFEDPGDKRLIFNLATLVFCGCLFLFWDESEMRTSDLYRFIHRNRAEEDIHKRLFLRFGQEPDTCQHYVLQISAKERREVEDIRQVCSSCRWAIFSDAFDLKQSIVDVPVLGIDWKMGSELEDMSDKNMPFIHEHLMREKGNNTHLFQSQIHPEFCLPNGSDPEVHYVVVTFLLLQKRLESSIQANACQDEHSLPKMKLCRKVYAYSIRERAKGVARAKLETRIAYIMSVRQPETVARLVRAFTHKSSDHEFIELIYPRYTGDLEDIFSGKHWSQTGSTSLELVDDPIWRALIQVVEAVKDMHKAIKERKIDCLGHLDIKPANILVEIKPTGVFLRLTDFGRAAEYSANHDGPVKRSTTSFAPPSLRPRAGDEHPRMGHYDVWSMACVLTQMLVFLNSGKEGLDIFNAQRQDHQDDAFWTNKSGKIELRSAVSNHLDQLQNPNRPRTSQMIKEGIARMLNLEDGDLLNIDDSLEILKRPQVESRTRGQEQILCGSENWDVSASSIGLHLMSKVVISIYRDSHDQMQLVRRNWEKEKITMALNFVVGPPQWDTALCREIRLIPQLFYERGRASKLYCRFSSFHENQVICFQHAGQLLDFIGVVTSQQILPRKPTDDNLGIGFAMLKCVLKESALFGKSHHFNSGRLQIWKQLDDVDFEKQYPRSASTQANGSSTTSIPKLPGRRTKPISMWKLVMWTTRQLEHSTKEENVCLVIDIGVKTWKLDSQYQAKNHAHIRIKRDNDDIRAVVFGPIIVKPNERAGYPGIPINPRQLDQDLNAMRLGSVQVQLDGRTDRDAFINTLREYGFEI